MRYIDPRLLIPVVAATALAQQQSPEAAAAEAALRSRAQEFFQLQVEKKYRQAESMVAEDTKDLYYNNSKFHMESFTIQSVELQDNNTRAKVMIKARMPVAIPAAGTLDFDVAQPTLWKIENGQWVWYVEQGPEQTPFGTIHTSSAGDSPASVASSIRSGPNPAALQQMVKIDRSSVVLTADEPQQTVTLTNELPGAVDLEVQPDQTDAFRVRVDKQHLGAGEKTLIHFTASRRSAETKAVQVIVLPLNTTLGIQVTTK